MKKLLLGVLGATFFFAMGTLFGNSEAARVARDSVQAIKSATIEAVANATDAETRTMVLAENPELISRIMEGGAFGGEYSMAAAQNMFGRRRHRRCSQ